MSSISIPDSRLKQYAHDDFFSKLAFSRAGIVTSYKNKEMSIDIGLQLNWLGICHHVSAFALCMFSVWIAPLAAYTLGTQIINTLFMLSGCVYSISCAISTMREIFCHDNFPKNPF